MKRTLRTIGYAALAAITVMAAHGQNSSAAATKTVIFAGGCFWCIQPAFDKANGVIKTVVGYSGGAEPNTTHEIVTSGETNYRETNEITYDPSKIFYEQFVHIYSKQKDPTPADGHVTAIRP